MADVRPFPPSARRRSQARQAGLHAASPLLVGGLACAAAVVALTGLGRAMASTIGAWIASACSVASDGGGSGTMATIGKHLGAAALPAQILALVLPVLAAIAALAVVAHLAQTRAIWLPRRRVPGAPTVPPQRVRRALRELTATATIAVVVVAWLWLLAPRLAALASVPLAGGLVVLSFVATLAIAWTALGVVDAIAQHAQLAGALPMTAAEKREDDRLSGADPRWRSHRAASTRADRSPRGTTQGRSSRATRDADRDLRDAVAGASVIVLGDDVAFVVAWDPVRRPEPTRTATGRGAQVTQMLALARRHAVPVHRDRELAAALAQGPSRIASPQWPRLADLVAAARSRR